MRAKKKPRGRHQKPTCPLAARVEPVSHTIGDSDGTRKRAQKKPVGQVPKTHLPTRRPCATFVTHHRRLRRDESSEATYVECQIHLDRLA